MLPMQNSGGVGGNATAVSSAMSSRQQMAPTQGTAPQQMGGGAGGQPAGGLPAASGQGPAPELAAAFQKIVQRGFAQEDIQTVMDFFDTLKSAVGGEQPGAPTQGAPAPMGPSA